MSKKPEVAIPTSTGAMRVRDLRGWIDAADRLGVARSDMLLKLTVRDAATLKGHPSVAVEEISFASGEMRFLGVRVEEGGVTASSFEPTPA